MKPPSSNIGAYLSQLLADGRIAGFTVHAPNPQGADLTLEGSGSPKAKGKKRKAALVETRRLGPGRWEIGLETRAECNLGAGRQWEASRLRQAARKAWRKAIVLRDLVPFEERLLEGKPVRVKFTRLGGRQLDPLVNLPSALKGIEDAVAYTLGVDDGSPLWRPTCAQEPGGTYGVRVELSLGEEE